MTTMPLTSKTSTPPAHLPLLSRCCSRMFPDQISYHAQSCWLYPCCVVKATQNPFCNRQEAVVRDVRYLSNRKKYISGWLPTAQLIQSASTCSWLAITRISFKKSDWRYAGHMAVVFDHRDHVTPVGIVTLEVLPLIAGGGATEEDSAGENAWAKCCCRREISRQPCIGCYGRVDTRRNYWRNRCVRRCGPTNSRRPCSWSTRHVSCQEQAPFVFYNSSSSTTRTSARE